jgi:hypothetical protein
MGRLAALPADAAFLHAEGDVDLEMIFSVGSDGGV